jgi:uncharacterized membrane protein
MIYIDYSILQSDWIKSFDWFNLKTPDGARALLSTVAGSMITVAGVVFSITIVALTLASGQFGPRLLENFMRDRGNQIVLGTFIATFIYCLLLLLIIRGGDNSFVPQLSITFALVLAVLSISVLIYFIDHAAKSIQVSNVIDVAKSNLDNIVEEMFPEKIGHRRKEFSSWWIAPEDLPPDLNEESGPVRTGSSGYIRVMDINRLMGLSSSRDLILKIEYKPGDFVVEGRPLAYVWPKSNLDEDLKNDIKGSFILGKRRTSEQDAKYAIDQIVEIAVRALSPGINDPFTAIMCIDNLTSALCIVAGRNIPSAFRYDKQNQLRVITKAITFTNLLDASFNQIRQYSQSSASITIRLMEAIAVIAEAVSREEDKEALLRHAGMIKRGSDSGLPEELDRKDVEEKYSKVLELLGAKESLNLIRNG